jgi:predicted HAD superfamily Cof-like phosphohydrolase
MMKNRKAFYKEPNTLESVAQFHTLFRCPVLTSPTLPAADRSKLRVSLLKEEVQELKDAIAQNDLVEVADALADIQYVLSGAILEFGA